jgi:hypothetical protein
MDTMFQRIVEKVENLLYPELRAYGRSERARLLKKASETPLDLIEWAGILVGLVIVASITRYGIPGFALSDRIAVALVNFLVAVPLLALTVGPFLLRRQKRGLRSLL